MKIVQIGTNKGYDDLADHLLSNHDSLDFGLFVEPNQLHIESIKKCYEKYSNAIIENIAIKVPSQNQDTLTIYYHTNDYPDYQLASCNIEHIHNHLWCPHLRRGGEGEIKSFDVPCVTIEDLFEKYSIKELDWLYLDVEGIDAEILLTTDWSKYQIKRIEFEQLHLKEHADTIYKMMLDMGYKQVDSLHPYDWSFEKTIHFSTAIGDKLKNFPPINFISIEESENRRKVLYENFENYGITNITPHIFKKYDDNDQIIYSDISFNEGRGPTTSHLKAIKKWYYDTDEEYAFFCEDDLSLETVKYWNFTWDEFISRLPFNWECIQLCLVRENMFYFYQNGIKFRPRCWCDWSACAYLIKRSHAKKIIANYYRDGEFNLNYKGSDYSFRLSNNNQNFLRPVVETIVFTEFTDQNSVYIFPLFVENSTKFFTTWCNNVNSINTKSYFEIIEWWKTIGNNLTLDEINLHEPQKT